jgi:hypothetical protein
MTGSTGGDSPLSSYEANVAAAAAAVQAAIAVNAKQQASAQAWLDAALPEPPTRVGAARL